MFLTGELKKTVQPAMNTVNIVTVTVPLWVRIWHSGKWNRLSRFLCWRRICLTGLYANRSIAFLIWNVGSAYRYLNKMPGTQIHMKIFLRWKGQQDSFGYCRIFFESPFFKKISIKQSRYRSLDNTNGLSQIPGKIYSIKNLQRKYCSFAGITLKLS